MEYGIGFQTNEFKFQRTTGTRSESEALNSMFSFRLVLTIIHTTHYHRKDFSFLLLFSFCGYCEIVDNVNN